MTDKRSHGKGLKFAPNNNHMKSKNQIGIVGAVLFGWASVAGAANITFDSYSPLFSQTGPVITDGFVFAGSNPGVWAGPGEPPGADNGTPYLIFWNDPSDPMIFTRVGGGSFFLNSLDLGLSFYTQGSTATATLTLANGGIISIDFPIDRTFQTVTIGLDVTSVSIIALDARDGYLAMDNVVVGASTIPDGGLSVAMLGMGMSGLAFIRRKLKD